MIILPRQVQEALTNKSRYITAKVYLEIDNEMVDITDTLINFSIDESVSEGSLPYGQITYNQLNVTLNNLDKRYMLNNVSSFYYGKLVALKRLQIVYEIEYAEEQYYYLALGDYYVDTWKATTDSSTATVTAYDTLYKYGSRPLISTRIYQDVTTIKAFQILFEANNINVNEYVIEPGLLGVFEYWWPEGETLADGLQTLAEIAGANVFSDKKGMIRVTPIWKDTPKVIDLKDGEVILNTKAEPSYREAYSTVDIKYKLYNELAIEEVYASDSDITISAGATINKEFRCKSTPIMDIINVSTYNTEHAEIKNYTCNNDTCKVTITNTSNKSITFGIKIFGRRIDTVDKEFISDNAIEANNTLNLSTSYILKEQDIIRLSTELKNLYKGKITLIELDVRALPNLELYDRVVLDSSYVGIQDEFYITKLSYDYSEGLMGSITLSASIGAIPQRRIFISPGLSILVKGVD